MPRPNNNRYRSEIFNQQPGYTPQEDSYKPYWENEYHYVTKLLEQKLLNFIRRNERLRTNIVYLARFVNVTETDIIFNLTDFKDSYKFKFIMPDFEGYCAKFIEIFTPVLQDFLKEIGYNAHGFSFKLRMDGNDWQKNKTVFAD
ncbi:MAG TPA: hypothetical protein VK541_11675 [Pedobacter sp.]|uniref:hypothetical protein n=1 Tax=Pedobacter sp. TaxID=1411316 RepID=UPI002B8C38B5|nr:hypothetical protein [Pedobacter sp.]HMI03136.1 hypothetical protein [Pedobacter sp.]